MDSPLHNLTQTKQKRFDNIIIQQVGINKKVPILPKPKLSDEPTLLPTLNTNDNSGNENMQCSSLKASSTSHSTLNLEKRRIFRMQKDLAKTQSMCTQGAPSKNSSLLINTAGNSNSQHLMKILPKLPMKALKRPQGGNILLQGPNNKIVSLQIKPPNSTVPAVSQSSNKGIGSITNAVNLNKNMHLLQNKLPTTVSLNTASTYSALPLSSTTTIKSPQLTSEVAVTQTIVAPFLTGSKVTSQSLNIKAAQPIYQNLESTKVNATTVQNYVSSKVNPISTVSYQLQKNPFNNTTMAQMPIVGDVNSNTNSLKKFGSITQNKNSTVLLNTGKAVQIPNIIIPATTSVVKKIPGDRNLGQTNLSPKILVPMGKLSSNVTISKTSLNSRLGPIEEPSPSISLIEKRNVYSNLTVPTSAHARSGQNTLINIKKVTSGCLSNNSIKGNQEILDKNDNTNLQANSKINKNSENKTLVNLGPSYKKNEENITIITQFFPDEKVSTNSSDAEVASKTKKIVINSSSSINKNIDSNNSSKATNANNSVIRNQTPIVGTLIKQGANLMLQQRNVENKIGFKNIETKMDDLSNITLTSNEDQNNSEEKSLSYYDKDVEIDINGSVIDKGTKCDLSVNSTKTTQNVNEMGKNGNEFSSKTSNKVSKQQSLLRNKNLETLKRSPRTLSRSKSLSVQSGKRQLKRRLTTTSSDYPIDLSDNSNSVENLVHGHSADNMENKRIESKLEKGKISCDKLNKALLCEETIETSPNISNETNQYPDKNNSDNEISIDNNLLQNLITIQQKSSQEEHKIPHNIISNNNTEFKYTDLIGNNSTFIEQIISNIKPNSAAQNAIHINELANILKWRGGIGLTKDNTIAFGINELGLLEIFEKSVIRNRLDIPYEKPVYQREKQSHKSEENAEPIYFCKGCNCHGAAIDFLAPEYCSHNCITRYEKRRSMKSTDLQLYINQQTSQKKLRKQKMSALLSDTSITSLNDESLPKAEFSWSSYLSSYNGQPAPIDLFLNPFPCGPNLFQVGMKLEAIDPEYSSLFCVCSVVEIKGYRLKIHFDGYSKSYDYWINADSMDIFPPGWCNKTNRPLQPPKHMNASIFNWNAYLMKTKAIAAPRNLFTHLNSSSNTNPFKVGIRFEADDLRNTRKVCVASVADVLDNRILVHFDGWDDRYDYWIDCNSPYIHPVNWHLQNNFEIVPPPDWKDIFNWQTYLNSIQAIPGTEYYFQTRQPIAFNVGMKLEIVDKKNPSLIRPGTVIMTDGYEIKILFDGWPAEYAFWVVDDNPDIHPVGWCDATCHELESPPEYPGLPSIMPCPVHGCRGIGNATRLDIDFHATEDSCPYFPINWKKELEKPERVRYTEIYFKGKMSAQKRKSNDINNLEIVSKYRKIENIEDFSDVLPNRVTNSNENNQRRQNHKEERQLNLIEQNLCRIKTEEKQDTNSDENIIRDPKIEIAKQLLCDYGPRLEQNYKLWIKFAQYIPIKLDKIEKNPLQWKVEEVVSFINRIPQCSQISEKFYKEDIDGEAFLSLRQKDLTDILNIKLGTAIKIYNLIILLRTEVIKRFS